MNTEQIKALANEAVTNVRNRTITTREANVYLGAGRLTLSVLRFEAGQAKTPEAKGKARK